MAAVEVALVEVATAEGAAASVGALAFDVVAKYTKPSMIIMSTIIPTAKSGVLPVVICRLVCIFRFICKVQFCTHIVHP